MRDTPAEAEARAQALGDAIRHALGDRTRRWLAEATGNDPTTISRFILGKQVPTLEQLADLAKALDVSTRSLLAGAGYIDDAGLIDPDRLPPGGRRAVRAIIAAFDGVNEDSPGGSDGVS